MFIGGALGIVLGLIVLYLINREFNTLRDEVAYQRSEIITLTELLRTIDAHVAAGSKHKGAESVNDKRAYISLINRDFEYDPDED